MKIDIIAKIFVVITFPLWLVFLIVTFAWKIGESIADYFIFHKEYNELFKKRK